MRFGFLSCTIWVIFEYFWLFCTVTSRSSNTVQPPRAVTVSSDLSSYPSSKPHHPVSAPLKSTFRKMHRKRPSELDVAHTKRLRRTTSVTVTPLEHENHMAEFFGNPFHIPAQKQLSKKGILMDVDYLPPIVIPYDAGSKWDQSFPAQSVHIRKQQKKHFDRPGPGRPHPNARNNDRGPPRGPPDPGQNQYRQSQPRDRGAAPRNHNPNNFHQQPPPGRQHPSKMERFPQPGVPNQPRPQGDPRMGQQHRMSPPRNPAEMMAYQNPNRFGPPQRHSEPRPPQPNQRMLAPEPRFAPGQPNGSVPPPQPPNQAPNQPLNVLRGQAGPQQRPPGPQTQIRPPAPGLPLASSANNQPPAQERSPILPAVKAPNKEPGVQPQPKNVPIISIPEDKPAAQTSPVKSSAEEKEEKGEDDDDDDENGRNGENGKEDDDDYENEASTTPSSNSANSGVDVHSSVYQKVPPGAETGVHAKPPVLPHLTTQHVNPVASVLSSVTTSRPSVTVSQKASTKFPQKGLKKGFDPSLGANTLREMGKEGETLRLVCPLTQNLETQANHIIWTSPEKLVFKSGKSGRHVVQPSGGLIIHNLQSVDEGNYTCSLVTGKNVVSNGTVLVDIEDCSMSPCMNGGECEDLDGKDGAKLTCRCPEAFKGRYCETKKNVWLLLIPIIGGGIVAVAIVAVIVRYTFFRNKTPKYQPIPQHPQDDHPLQPVRASYTTEPRAEILVHPSRRFSRPLTSVVPYRAASYAVPSRQDRGTQFVYAEPRRTVQMVPRYSQPVAAAPQMVYTEPVQYVTPVVEAPVAVQRPPQRFSQPQRMSWKYVDGGNNPGDVPVNVINVTNGAQPEVRRMSVPLARDSWNPEGVAAPHDTHQPVVEEVSIQLPTSGSTKSD